TTIEQDKSAYQEVLEKDTIEAYKGYLSKYPNGMYRQEAEEKIKSIIENDNKAFELATRDNTIDSFTNYITNNPNGLHIPVAKDKIKELTTIEQDKSAYQEVLEKDTIEAYKGYLSKYPNGMYRQEAEEKITSIQKKTFIDILPIIEDYFNFKYSTSFLLGISLLVMFSFVFASDYWSVSKSEFFFKFLPLSFLLSFLFGFMYLFNLRFLKEIPKFEIEEKGLSFESDQDGFGKYKSKLLYSWKKGVDEEKVINVNQAIESINVIKEALSIMSNNKWISHIFMSFEVMTLVFLAHYVFKG
ncbi:MAG: hypothetical protein PHQ22_09140, partial [Sulfuricurvum sp.]|nr:hypothetical protein [Sulfuricurvum sp.]